MGFGEWMDFIIREYDNRIDKLMEQNKVLQDTIIKQSQEIAELKKVPKSKKQSQSD